MSSLTDYLESGSKELGLDLTREQQHKFALFADELLKWNSKINLTAITSPEDIAVKHFLDSLSVLKSLGQCQQLLDIGSGAGFPSIPLKIVAPEIGVMSVDAVEKKILFQKHVARQLQLERFRAVHIRAEKIPPEYHGYFDVIVSRAFSNIPTFVRIAAPLLAPNGVMIAMKGKDGRREAEDSSIELSELGVAIANVCEFRLPLLEEMRSLVMIRRK